MAVFDLRDDAPTTRKGIRQDLKDQHRRALEGFHASASFFNQQRKREVEDLKFYDFDDQWDPTAKTSRAGGQAVNGLPPTPPRPTIVVNQIRGPVQQVANTRRAARLALQFAPKGGGATDDTAEAFEDIVRGIQQESRASIARNWAADRAEKCGIGWYRIDTAYAEDGADTDPAAWNDQDLIYQRILNQASVYPDPHAQEPDFSDGRRWYVTEDIPFDVYKELYPESDLAGYANAELQATGDHQPKWVFTSQIGEDGEASQVVRVAEVWEVREAERRYIAGPDGRAQEVDKAYAAPAGTSVKRVKHRAIWWAKINAVEYLEEPIETDWAYVPLIPVIGHEYNVDGERRWDGIVRPARDAQMSYNTMRAAQIEQIGTATKAPYIAYMETIEPFVNWWKQSNIRNFFVLPIKAAYDKAGNLLPPPKRNVEEPPIQAMTIAAAAARDDIHMTTGVPPAALGQLDPHDRSGKAIANLQSQAEIGSSDYLDNLVSISLALEGKILRSAIPIYYDRPGRIVPAIGLDEKRRLVMVNAPFISGPDGHPRMLPNWQEGQPVPPEIPGPPDPQTGQPSQIPVTFIDLKRGAFSVTPTVGKSYATRREEASAAIGNVLQVVPPELAAAIAPAWLEEQDYPGAKKIAEIAKNALPPPLRAAYQDEQGQIPPAAQAQIQQLQGQVQQLTQLIQGKQVEQAGKLQQVQLQEQAENLRAEHTDQTAIEKALIAANATMSVAQAKVDAENFRSYVDASEQRIANLLNMHLEKVTQALEHGHQAAQTAADHAHEAQMAETQHRHAMAQADQAAVHGLVATQQQADVTPTPTDGA